MSREKWGDRGIGEWEGRRIIGGWIIERVAGEKMVNFVDLEVVFGRGLFLKREYDIMAQYE